MKNKRLLDVMEQIDDAYIEEAAPKKMIRRKFRWMKWCSAAACMALVIIAGISAVHIYRWYYYDDKVIEVPVLVDYDNAYYEVIDGGREGRAFLQKYGLPEEISEELIGEHVAYLEKSGSDEYTVSTRNAAAELLDYAPAPCKGLRILREKDSCFWAVFCNYHTSHEESLPFEEIFRVYGIENAEDIASITAVKDYTWKINGNCVTDADEIETFYYAAISLKDYSFDEYEKMTFEGRQEENDLQDKRYDVYAESCHNLLIETKQGLKFGVTYNRDFGWMEGSETLSYYELSHAMLDWLNVNFDN